MGGTEGATGGSDGRAIDGPAADASALEVAPESRLDTQSDDSPGQGPDASADSLGACGADGGVAISPAITFGSLPLGQSQRSSAVAFDGTNYLVVWQAGLSTGLHWRLYGSRVSPSGVVLDEPPLLISDGPATAATVAFNGTDYIVAWEDFRSGATSVYGARVTPEGGVRDTAGVPIQTTGVSSSPSIACGPSGCLVAYATGSGPLFATRVDSSVVPVDQPHIMLPAGGFPRVAATDSGYFVAWYRGMDFHGSRISADARILDSDIGIGSPAFGHPPAVAFDGTNVLVTWEKWMPFDGGGGMVRLHGTRVAGANLLDPAGFPIATRDDQTFPAVAYDGTSFVVIWSAVNGAQGARVTSAGALVDDPAFLVDRGSYPAGDFPEIASAGTGTSLVVADSCVKHDAGAPDCSLRAHFVTNCMRR